MCGKKQVKCRARIYGKEELYCGARLCGRTYDQVVSFIYHIALQALSTWKKGRGEGVANHKRRNDHDSVMFPVHVTEVRPVEGLYKVIV